MAKRNRKSKTLSRAKVLKRYKISLGTLDTLIGTSTLKGKFEHRHGKSFLPISERDDFVLRSARNEIRSFEAALPFHRFLVLRMVNTSLDEIYDEIFQIGLLSSEKHFTKDHLKTIHSIFLRNTPIELRSLFKARRAPRKKEQEILDLFLETMSIKVYYEHPKLIEDLLFFLGMKSNLEAMLTTIASAEDVTEAVSKVAGLSIPLEAVVSYRIMLYSTHDISTENMDAYLSLLPPKERRVRKEARTLTLSEFCVRHGVDQAMRAREVLETIFLQAQREVLRLTKIKTPESAQVVRAAFDRLLKAHEAIEAMGETSGKSREDIAKMFDKFVVRKVTAEEMGPVFTIHDVQGAGKAKSVNE